MEQPNFVEEVHLKYLDRLRESGVTNMWGATPYVAEMFPKLTREQALKVLIYWMSSFKRRNRK